MKHTFEVLAMNKDFEIVSLLRYVNLQWSRKFYEAGTFSIQIPIEQYDVNMKYIYTKDRPEVGEISQINYIDDGNTKVFCLSGYFLEEEVNRRIVYRLATSTNIIDGPSWNHISGHAEDVAFTYFNAFKDVKYLTLNNVTKRSLLGISSGVSEHRGKTSDHYRGNEQLGNKIHTILKPSRMSFMIDYDFDNNKKVFKVWSGRDLTQDNKELNNPVIFSTRYGNLKNPNIVVSDSDYKNCYIVDNTYTPEDSADVVVVRAGNEALESDTSDRFVLVESDVIREDFNEEMDYLRALEASGHSELLAHQMTMSFDFEVIEGSYDYMVDFDLGDYCSLVVSEMGFSEDAVLSGCIEVIKQGEWSMTMEFDV